MSSRFDRGLLTALEERAYDDVMEFFSEHVKLFPGNHLSVERLERDMARIALAANMAASKKSPARAIRIDASNEWFKDIDLVTNICLAHRHLKRGVEYAVVEHLPQTGRNEIRHKGPNVVDMLRAFTREQRQELEIWKTELTSEISKFLGESYPGQEMGRVIERFSNRLAHAIPRPAALSPGDAPNHSARV